MDEPSYENEEPKIRVIDVIDQQQSTASTYPDQQHHHHRRRRRSLSPSVEDSVKPSPYREKNGDGLDYDDNNDDDGDPDRGILSSSSWDKRLSPDGASNNNADELSEDAIHYQREGT